jgi:hypothetical protein
MDLKQSKFLNLFLIFGAILVTLVATPNFNKDSLVIPKNIILFCMALFFLPILMKELKLSRNRVEHYSKSLTILLLSLLVSAIFIFLNSEAPIEQLLFGRSGRGLGFFSFFSILILTMFSSLLIKKENLKIILIGISTAGLFSSFYASLQYFGLDFFDWDTKTNGIIGTLGNPNFQSSFVAMTFVSSIISIWHFKYRIVLSPIIVTLQIFTLFITNSTQGYIGVSASVIALSLVFLWFKNKKFFSLLLMISTVSGIFAVAGMLGKGPLSDYLYKISVQSRGDFWRSAFTTGNANPFFGVGFDSFGDYSLKYRDITAASHVFAEYTDSAHNYYLDYLASGGYFFLFLQVVLSLLVLYSFFVVIKNHAKFEIEVVGLFTCWLVFQLQAFISPMSIPFMTWNAIISGSIIGIASQTKFNKINKSASDIRKKVSKNSYWPSSLLFLVGLIIMFPYFNSDKQQLTAIRTGNGDLLMKAVTMYPESVLKYSQASRDLLSSGLPEQSLYLARKAVEFNPNSPALWSLILINPLAPQLERINAKKQILELDPLNKEVKEFIISGN